MVKQNTPTIDHLGESIGTIKAHSMVVLLCAYIMAWIALDDNTLYQRGPGKTFVRVRMAARIAAPYIMLVAVYHIASNKSLRLQDRRDTETTMSAMLDMMNFVILAVLANFVLTTVAYVYAYIWTMEGVGEADEDYNFMDVVDMRKVRLGVRGKACSFSQEEDGFGGFRDYGVLQTTPLGTGTPPLENLAGKMSWYIDAKLSGHEKEGYEDHREKSGYVYNFFGFLGDGLSNLFGSIPLLNSASTMMPLLLGVLSVFKTGGATAVIIPALVKLTVILVVVNSQTSTNLIDVFRDPAKVACVQGVVSLVISAFLFAIPDRVFKITLRNALPKPDVSYDFAYYAPAMDLLREKGGFCTPAAWQGYAQWIWQRGSLPDALARGSDMEKLVKEMEGSRLAWPSAVYRSSIMAAYNKLKSVHIEAKNGSDPGKEFQKPANSVVFNAIKEFEPALRKHALRNTMLRVFYEKPDNFPNKGADVADFKRFQHEYVSRQLRRARDLFSLRNVREHYVDLKKLGLDMESIKIEFPRLVARGETHVPPDLVEDALFAYVQPPQEDRDAAFLDFEAAMIRGQRRVMRVTAFLSNQGTENRYTRGSGVCGAILPGPPAFTEERQYRFNAQSGLFTLLPILNYDQGHESSKSSTWENLYYWWGNKQYVPSGTGRWSDDMGMYV